jgi:DNA-binding NtrC family response regulator
MDGNAKQEIVLKAGERITIGRADPAGRAPRADSEEEGLSARTRHYRSPHPDVSEVHLELRMLPDGRVVGKDLGSTNGTLARVPPRQDFELSPNSEVLLGRSLSVQLRTPLWDSMDDNGRFESAEDFAKNVEAGLQDFGATVQIVPSHAMDPGRLRGQYTRLPLPAHNAYLLVNWCNDTINLWLERWVQRRVLLFNSGSLCIPVDKLDRVPWQFTGASISRQTVLRAARRVAATDGTVLLCGKTGVGKDVLAHDIHHHSARAAGPFLAFNCATIVSSIAEGVLFGTEKGTFTEAQNRPGLFEQAHGGTLFLDEIGDLQMEMQAKLLRVLEDKRVRRVGGLFERPVNVRIIAATNRNLPAMISQGTFREDLWFRLEGVQLHIVELQKEDIHAIVPSFYEEGLRESGQAPLCDGEVEQLAQLAARQEWPGNARQLRSAMRRYLTFREPSLSVRENWHSATHSARDASPEPSSQPALDAGAEGDDGELPADLMTVGPLVDRVLTLTIARAVFSQKQRWGAWTLLGRRLGMTGPGAQDKLRRLGIATDQPIEPAVLDRHIQEALSELQPHRSILGKILKM